MMNYAMLANDGGLTSFLIFGVEAFSRGCVWRICDNNYNVFKSKCYVIKSKLQPKTKIVLND